MFFVFFCLFFCYFTSNILVHVQIKVVDPVALTCSSIVGTGKAGFKDGAFLEAEFNEPGDLEFSLDCKLLYVADTNNHKIRLIDMERENVSTVSDVTLHYHIFFEFKSISIFSINPGYITCSFKISH